MITLKNITKSYILNKKKISIIKDLNLEIKKGKMIALTGQSGSGKSTLLNIIGMLDKYDTGEYFLDNILIKNFDENKLTEFRNKYLGFIFQHFYLINFKTAIENVALPLYYRKIRKEERNIKAANLLKKVGLGDKLLNFPKELSGGQQQRVSIARALVTESPIILADEPTGALDSTTSEEIMKLLQKINDEGKTILIVTHDPKVAQKCDMHIQMIDGRILK